MKQAPEACENSIFLDLDIQRPSSNKKLENVL